MAGYSRALDDAIESAAADELEYYTEPRGVS